MINTVMTLNSQFGLRIAPSALIIVIYLRKIWQLLPITVLFNLNLNFFSLWYLYFCSSYMYLWSFVVWHNWLFSHYGSCTDVICCLIFLFHVTDPVQMWFVVWYFFFMLQMWFVVWYFFFMLQMWFVVWYFFFM